MGDSVSDTAWLEPQDPGTAACVQYLKTCNGHWGAARVEHYCPGCCPYGDVEAFVDNFYAAAYAVDLLCTREKEPSLDEWQAAGRACGKASGGVRCHELLPRAFVWAVPRGSASRKRPFVLSKHLPSQVSAGKVS